MDNESLVKEIQAGHNRDDNLMQLWKQNKPLIDMYLRKFNIDGMTDDDLRQEAFIGMMKAVETYDSDQAKFMTYAQYHIEGMLGRAASRCFPAPERIKVLYHRYLRTVTALTTELERAPTTEEIRERLEISKDEMEMIQRAGMMVKSASLNTPTEDEEAELLDTIADDTDIEEIIVEKDYREYLRKVVWEEVDKLHEITSKVIRLIYQSKLTMNEAAALLKLSPSRVYDIHRKGLKLLKTSKLRHLLDTNEFRKEAVEFSPFKQNWQATIEYLLDLETDLNREYRRRI